jgi:hypothetical protein
MDLSLYTDILRDELAVAAEAGGDEARALAERLTGPLESATRLVLLEVLSAAADEITRELAPGAVELRLRGRDPSFVVTPPPGTAGLSEPATAEARPWTGGTMPSAAGQPVPAAAADDDEGGTSRLNLRIPDALKARIEEAARREGLSLNAWLVRAAAAAVGPDTVDPNPTRRNPRGGESYTGWVR